MAWRRATVADTVTVADTEVWEYTLPQSGVLNGFLLQVENTNGGTDNVLNPIYKNVNWIEVVDGSRVLMRLTGVQAQFLSLINSGAMPVSRFSEVAGVVQTYQALLLFGLVPYDTAYGLDLSQLINPKVRVDIDFTAVRAAGATSFVSGSGRLSMVLLINDGADVTAPERFVKSHEIKRWTSAGSGDEVTQAPLDGEWARVIVRAHVAGSLPHAVLTDIRATFDAGQFVALQEETEWQANALPMVLGSHPVADFDVYRTDSETLDLEHAGSLAYSTFPDNAVDNMALTGHLTGNVTTDVLVAATGAASATDRTWAIKLWPTMPFMSMMWDFVPQGFLDVAQYQRGDIVLTQGVASAACSIVLQQLMANVVGT